MYLTSVILCLCFCFAWCTPGDKSQAKCKEYAEYVYSQEESPVLRARSKIDKVSQCGIVEVPLIIGGVRASEKEFPHMALLGFGKSSRDPNLSWKCGGALISETFVLTAAHCLTATDVLVQKVRFGGINLLETDESIVQERTVKKKIVHPKYSNIERYHDIALLELSSSVDFDGYVRPACLNTVKNIREKSAIASGFGKTDFDATEGSKYLMKVILNIIPSKDCGSFYKQDIKAGTLSQGITNSILCAGELKGGKDTCQGDSGGPLQTVLKEPYCMYNIIGVVSFGKFCGFANMPAIYTRVSAYLDWIEPIVWP